MAYAFDRVFAAMGRGPEEDQAGTQPFAAGSDSIQASSTEGSAGPGGGAPGGGAQTQAPKAEQATPADRSRLFERNAGRVSSPTDLDQASQKIKGANDALQNKANTYVAGADDRFEKLDDKDRAGIKSFAGLAPPPAAGAPTSDWDSAYQKGAGQVKPFETSDINTDVGDVNMLSTDAGLQELFRRQGGAEYNAGSAALDMALLRKNTKFNELRDQVLAQNKSLQDVRGKIGEETTKKGQAALDTAYGGWKGAVEGELGGAIGEYEQHAKDREKQFDMGLGMAGAMDTSNAIASLAGAKQRLVADNPDLQPYVDQLGDAAPAFANYYTAPTLTADKTNYQDFITADDAGNWNKVLGMLGKGGTAPVAGQYAGVNASDVAKGRFDSAGYYGDLLKKAGGLQAKSVAEANAKATQAAVQKAADDAAKQKAAEDARDAAEQAARETEEKARADAAKKGGDDNEAAINATKQKIQGGQIQGFPGVVGAIQQGGQDLKKDLSSGVKGLPNKYKKAGKPWK